MARKFLCPHCGRETDPPGPGSACRRCAQRLDNIRTDHPTGDGSSPKPGVRTPPEGVNDLLSKTIDGQYDIQSVLGFGGFGVVYLATDRKLKRQVAIKLLHRIDPKSAARFRRETALLTKTTHPNVVPVFDRGEYEGRDYIVCRYVPGRTLDQIIGPGGIPDPARACSLVAKLLRALHHIHSSHGILHRDVKPTNIMLLNGDMDALYLMDFGLAIEAGGTQITSTGQRLGTPAYMSPEQFGADRESITHATDLYSSAVVLYQLLTGWLPFASPSEITTYPAPKPSTLRAGIDSALEAIILKGLEKDPAKRFRDGEEFASRLEEWVAASDGGPASIAAGSAVAENRTTIKSRAATESKPESTAPQAGLIDGRYEVIREIGSGGFGTVVHALDLQTHNRSVAIKMLHRHIQNNAEIVRRFQAEASLLAKVGHPNVLPVFAQGTHEGQQYIVFMYVDGKTLKDAMEAGAMSDPVRACLLVAKLAKALHHVYSKHNILHRDVKPANLMLIHDDPDALYLMDFGLAVRDDTTRHTNDGAVMGTIPYMSPEQVRGAIAEIGHPSDLYSCSVVLFQMLTGRLPFTETHSFSLMHEIIDKAPPVPSSLKTGLDPELDRLVLKGLEKESKNRYETGLEFATKLEEWAIAARSRPSGSKSVMGGKKPTPATGGKPGPRPAPAPVPVAVAEQDWLEIEVPSEAKLPTMIPGSTKLDPPIPKPKPVVAPQPFTFPPSVSPPPPAAEFRNAPPRRPKSGLSPVLILLAAGLLIAGVVTLVLAIQTPKNTTSTRPAWNPRDAK